MLSMQLFDEPGRPPRYLNIPEVGSGVWCLSFVLVETAVHSDIVMTSDEAPLNSTTENQSRSIRVRRN